jgi:exodeoxyribonuclease VII small subunit
MSPKSKSIDSLTFEEAFAEMESIVAQLEAGQLALDAALALHERGQALAAHCQQLLERAELRVQQLVPRPNGGYGLAPFDSPSFGGAAREPDQTA